MSLKLCLVLVVALAEAIVSMPNSMTIGTIDAHMVIEQNGTQLSAEPPLVTTREDIRVKLVVKNPERLINASYAWFVDDLELEASRSSELIHRLQWAKEYKVMAVVLATECKTEDRCDPKFGIIWRKVLAVHRNAVQRAHNLTDIWSEAAFRSKKRLSEVDYHSIYTVLIISGALLLILILVSIIIYLTNISSKNRAEKNDSKKALIDKQRFYDNKYRLYTMGL